MAPRLPFRFTQGRRGPATLVALVAASTLLSGHLAPAPAAGRAGEGSADLPEQRGGPAGTVGTPALDLSAATALPAGPAPRAATGPPGFTFQGFLTDDQGAPLDALIDLMTVRIYDWASNTQMWELDYLFVPVDEGVFSLPIVPVVPFPADLFDGSHRTLGVSIDGGPELQPRASLSGTPYANWTWRASWADSLSDGAGVRSLNGVRDDVTLQAGTGIAISEVGNTVTIDATGGGGSSPWTQNGTEISYQGGSVLIGTDTAIQPQPLYVAGDAEIGGGASASDSHSESLVMHSESADWWVAVQNEPTESASDFFIGKSHQEDGMFHITRDGDIGMGTSSPSADLHVAEADDASVLISADVDDTGPGIASLWMFQGGQSNTARLALDSSHVLSLANDQANDIELLTDQATRVTVDGPTGHVGIGTTTPAERLHVSGGTGSAALIVEADTDNSNENDQPSLELRQDAGQTTARLGFFNGSNDLSLLNDVNAKLHLGTDGAPYMTLRNGNVGIGTNNPVFPLQVVGTVVSDAVDVNGAVSSLTLDVDGLAQVGVLEITGGADLAEPFRVAEGGRIRAGTVLAIDPARPGQLRVADRPYDRRVAGIASGANGVRSGLMLRQEGTAADGDVPVALSGRVYCLADASHGAIEPGDLLTTSPTPGHAMKAADAIRAPGAVLGKAMTGLARGRGHVLVLVTLQ